MIDQMLPNTTRGRDIAGAMRADPPVYRGMSVEFLRSSVVARMVERRKGNKPCGVGWCRIGDRTRTISQRSRGAAAVYRRRCTAQRSHDV